MSFSRSYLPFLLPSSCFHFTVFGRTLADNSFIALLIVRFIHICPSSLRYSALERVAHDIHRCILFRLRTIMVILCHVPACSLAAGHASLSVFLIQQLFSLLAYSKHLSSKGLISSYFVFKQGESYR